MVSFAFKLMAFSIILNLSVGLFGLIGGTGEWQYNAETESGIIDEMQEELASPPVEGSVSFGEKILDFFSLGLYTKIKAFLLSTILALPNYFIQGGLINQKIANVLYSFFIFIYITGMFQIFTGKNIWGSK